MPRLKSIEPTQATGRAAELLAGPSKGRHTNMIKALAVSPAALEAYLALDGILHAAPFEAADLDATQRRLVQLVVAQALGSHYDIAAQVAKARTLGLTDEHITAARRGHSTDPAHHALIRFTLALHEKLGRISDADVATFRAANFTDAALAQTIALHALTTFSCTLNLANQTPVDSPPAPEI